MVVLIRCGVCDRFYIRAEVRHVLAPSVYKPGMADDGKVRVWLVERTYSDDEQNLIILEYATIDGERYMRKERALTSFDDVRETTAAIDVDPGNVAPVKDDGLRERYAAEAERISQRYEPEESV